MGQLVSLSEGSREVSFRHLPAGLCREILSEWVGDLPSIVAFDTACSSPRYHALCFEALGGVQIKLHHAEQSADMWLWIQRRNMRLSSVRIDSTFASAPFVSNFLLSLSLEPHLELALDMDKKLFGLIDSIAGQRNVANRLTVTFHRRFADDMCLLVETHSLPQARGLIVKELERDVDVGSYTSDYNSKLVCAILRHWTPRCSSPSSPSSCSASLTSLDLGHIASLNDETLKIVRQFSPSLTSLHLSLQDFQFSPHAFPQCLSELTSLTTLYISGHGESRAVDTDSVLSIIPNLPRLQDVEFNRCPGINVYSVYACAQTHCPSLSRIALSNTSFREFLYSKPDEELALMPRMEFQHQIVHLTLIGPMRRLCLVAPHGLDAFLPFFQRWGRELKRLEYFGTPLEYPCLKSLAEYCPRVEAIHFQPNPSPEGHAAHDEFSVRNLSAVFGKELKELSVFWCPRLNDLQLTAILPSCPQIKRIGICYTSIGRESFRYILHHCAEVERVEIRYCALQIEEIVDVLVNSPRVRRPFVLCVRDPLRLFPLAGTLPWTTHLVCAKKYILRRIDRAVGKRRNAWRARQPNGDEWIEFKN